MRTITITLNDEWSQRLDAVLDEVNWQDSVAAGAKALLVDAIQRAEAERRSYVEMLASMPVDDIQF